MREQNKRFSLRREGPCLLLILLLAIQSLVVMKYGTEVRNLSGDEHYYVKRSGWIIRHGRLPKADKAHYDAQEGKTFRKWSDFRPQGYPLFLAALGIDENNHPDRRKAATAIQLLLISIVLMTLLRLVPDPFPAKWIAAVAFGVQPWTFEFAASLYPDSLNASLYALGCILLARSPYFGGRPATFLPGVFSGVLLGACMFLRPEMFLFSFFPVAILGVRSIVFKTGNKKTFSCAMACFVAIASFFVIFVGHRLWFEGRLFAQFVHVTPGLEEWGKTWIGTERERYGLVWGLREGKKGFDDIPQRAFSGHDEQERIRTALNNASRAGTFTKEADDVFLKIAEERKKNLLGGLLWPKAWCALHLWLNVDTNPYLLMALSAIHRPLRLLALGALLFLKIVVVVAIVMWTAKNIGKVLRTEGAVSDLALLSISVVVARTALFGFILDLIEHRYVLLCWPMALFLFAIWTSEAMKGGIWAKKTGT